MVAFFNMGNHDSKLPRPDPSMDYFLLSFQPPDRLKLALVDEDTIDNVRRTCHSSWSLGFHADTRCSDGSYKIRFAGNPFSTQAASSKPNIFDAKLLILKILSNLYDIGWQLVVTSELTKDHEASTWFFKRYAIIFYPPPTPTKKKNIDILPWKSRLFSVSLHSVDKLQLINGPENIKQSFQIIVQKFYTPGVEDKKQSSAEIFEFKLRGKTWQDDLHGGKDIHGALEGRKLILNLFKGFRKLGYKTYGVSYIGDSSRNLYFIDSTNDFIDDDDRFCLISLYDEGGLVLIDASDAVVTATKAAINNIWPGGIQGEDIQSPNGESVSKFKIKGRPWRPTGPDTVATHRFVSSLFRTLLSIGWCVDQALEISGHSSAGKTTNFVMRSCDRQSLPHACINLADLNKIRIIGDGSWVTRHQSASSSSGSRERTPSVDSSPPQSPKLKSDTPTIRRRHSSSSKRRLTKSTRYEVVSVPPSSPGVSESLITTPRLLVTPPSDEHLPNSASASIPQAYLDLIQLVRTSIERSWPYGIDRERDYYGSREFRLQGCPWVASNHCGSGANNRKLMAGVTMCYILKSIMDAGWRVYASVDISSSRLCSLNPVKGAVSNAKKAAASVDLDSDLNPLAPAVSDVHSWFLVYQGVKHFDNI